MTAPLIDLADVTFNQPWQGTPGADGCFWFMRIPKGWGNLARRVEIGEIPGVDGGDEVYNQAVARPLVCRGMVRAPNEAAAAAAYERIQSALPGPGYGRRGVLVVHEPIPKALTVLQLRAEPEEPECNVVLFELELAALDPYKRGLTPTVTAIAAGATVTVPNAGKAPTQVRVQTTSAGTIALRHDASGALLSSRAAVSSGVVVDTTTKLDVANVLSAASEWLWVPAGGGPLTNLGTADVNVTTYPSYF